MTVRNDFCTSEDEIILDFLDCEVRLSKPKIFTPNGDQFNPRFVPLEYNFLESGTMSIVNRWGEQVFIGDLFTGWSGMVGKAEASSGVYYFKIFYKDKNGEFGTVSGPLTLTR